MAPVLTAGQWGRWESESPLGLHWGPRRCDPPVGREDPSLSAAVSTLAGSLRPQEEGSRPLWPLRCLAGVELFCLQLLRGSSPDPLTGARRLRWGLAGTWAAGDSAPGLRARAREAPGAQHLSLGPGRLLSMLSAAHVCFPGTSCPAGASAARVPHHLPDGGRLSWGLASFPGTPSPWSCAFL